MTIKLPEPAGVITSKLGDHVGFKSAEVKKGDVVYTHAQLVQAVKDALEEAADLCETFDATDPKYLAVKIREMKEDIQ